MTSPAKTLNKSENRVASIIRARAQLKIQNSRKQLNLIQPENLWHDQIGQKLAGLYETAQFWNFAKCGEESIFRTCRECAAVERFDYKCSIKWCPRCQWKLQKIRAEKLKIWASKIAQPKHLVTTQKNFAVLTQSKIRQHQENLVALRRSKIFRDVRGGAVSVEITNEGKGWHLHAHWLLDVDYIHAGELAEVWGKLVGQEFAIVKIKDVRDSEFVNEVTKYLAKGNEIASWSPEHINEFVRAVRGRRFFFPFGSLFKLGAEIREQIELTKPDAVTCDCGACRFKFDLGAVHEHRELEREARQSADAEANALRKKIHAEAERQERERAIERAAELL